MNQDDIQQISITSNVQTLKALIQPYPVNMALHARIDSEPNRCRALLPATLRFRSDSGMLWHSYRGVNARLKKAVSSIFK